MNGVTCGLRASGTRHRAVGASALLLLLSLRCTPFTAGDPAITLEAGVDGGSSGDGAVSAPSDAGEGGAAATFCTRQQQPFIDCWDFDDSTSTSPQRFDGIRETGGKISVGPSPEGEGQVLGARIPTMSGTKNVWARKTLSLAAGNKGFDLNYRFFIRPSDAYFAALGTFFQFGPTPEGGRAVGLAFFGIGTKLSMTGNDQAKVPTSIEKDTTGRWHDASLIYRLGSPATVMLKVDNVLSYDGPADSDGGSNLDVRFGAFYLNDVQVAGIEVFYDDIVLRAIP